MVRFGACLVNPALCADADGMGRPEVAVVDVGIEGNRQIPNNVRQLLHCGWWRGDQNFLFEALF